MFNLKNYSPTVSKWFKKNKKIVNKKILDTHKYLKGKNLSEIKYAQVSGFDDYSVFTRKPLTDLSWMGLCYKFN